MTQAISLHSSVLQGRRVLVAEDEYMIARHMIDMLSDAGAEPLGPLAAVVDVLQFVAGEHRLDAALLDVNLRDGLIWPAVDALLVRGVPVVLTTGYDAGAIPERYAALPRCEKPAFSADLTRMLERVLATT